MSRLAAISSRMRSSGGNCLWLAFFALALLWLWMIAMIGGYISWSVHGLLFLAGATGFLVLEQKTRFMVAAREFSRSVFQCRLLVSLGSMTGWFFVNLLRVPIRVALSIAYLVGLFSTAIFLLLTMTN